MPSLFYGINVALRAVLAQQQVIAVVEHNVANANTPGYRRQRAELNAGPPYAPPSLFRDTVAGQMGSGVEVTKISRFNIEFFDERYRRELSGASQHDVASSALRQVESTMAETSADGLLPKLDAFWSGWQAVNTNPANLAIRADLRVRSEALVNAFNRRSIALNDIRRDQDLSIIQRVDEINTAADQVARLNLEISHVLSIGDQPNDLMDERDRQLDKLSKLAGAYSHQQTNGEMAVSIGGHALVVGSTTFKVDYAQDPNPGPGQYMTKMTWAADGQAFNVTTGEVAGLLDVRDRVIPTQKAGLDALAADLAARVNAAHQTGFGLPPTNANLITPGMPVGFTGNFFDVSGAASGGAAVAIKLDGFITGANGLDYIAAASAPDSPGDGNNARFIADLQAQQSAAGLGNTTVGYYYQHQIGNLALELKGATAAAADRKLVAESLNAQREEVGGVSLDEEAANLASSQRAYQAALRLVTVIDQMMDEVINRMGV